MTIALLASALLAGLVGGLHCATMCGGFVTAIAARAGSRPLLPMRNVVQHQLGYHAGRLATYMALGTAFGAAGAATVGAIDFLPLQQGLYVVANTLLLILAFGIAVHTVRLSWLERLGFGAFTKVLPWGLPLVQGGSLASRFGLGVLWGFVPCTLVYSVLPLALFAGGAWQGALLMFAFGLGTLPHLLGFGWLLQRTRQFAQQRIVRRSAAGLMSAFALVGIYRALYLPETLAYGPFCLTS